MNEGEREEVFEVCFVFHSPHRCWLTKSCKVLCVRLFSSFMLYFDDLKNGKQYKLEIYKTMFLMKAPNLKAHFDSVAFELE